MREVIQEAISILNKTHPLVVATVVKTKGSTPQKPGSKLLVRSDGTGVGTLGGGCVEGDIWFAASELLKNKGKAQYKEYTLNEDLAAQEGLVCGGTMYFLIDPIYEAKEYIDFAKEIENAYKGGPSVAVATLTKAPAHKDYYIGMKLLIRSDGSILGTLGNIEIDQNAYDYAQKLMIYGKNEYVKFQNDLEYFIEAFTTPPQLVICGAGHVAKAIYPIAKNLGFKIFITDDRKEFANEKRFPGVDKIISLKPEDAFLELPINPNTFVVIATRGHRYDHIALKAAAITSASYVGLLGSKRKTILVYEDLVKSGLSIDRIKEIRAPIGLDIHARTPAEIALSVMSEIMMFRLGGTGKPMKLEEWRVDKIFQKLKN
ncbi:MAG: hypothetical protein CL758_01485 [Chloroflexi bacterium]|nr:hypothetical protein [Chloroflexota bacterium]|tara:strand:+ start:3209 stop:4327 length:1119 start_codon:yes stop_codon:yes gene_type:complete